VIDIDKAIANAVRTGKVLFGTKSAIQNAQSGKVKMIILASNCPKNAREELEYYSKLSNIPLVMHRGTSMDLAAVCGRPFTVSALSIREAGDSEILKLTEPAESEESIGGEE
jgi:large subunit ribosomal protein L30e